MIDSKNAPRIVQCGSDVFRIIDGRRYWISEPSAEWLADAAKDQREERDV